MKFLESEFDDFFSLIYDVDPELTSLISAVENQYFANSTTPSAIERQTINVGPLSIFFCNLNAF